MLLIDFSNLVFATIHSMTKNNSEIDINLFRHIILNDIFLLRKKCKEKDVVICCDGRNYWRKQEFQYYKASRKKSREDSTIDWDEVFKVVNELIEEFKTELPYKVLQVQNCEADDIIATLSLLLPDKITIISSDKDFLQLQESKYDIRQYSKQVGKWLDVSSYGSLIEKVLRGDSGDGIPSYLSDDDTFVNPDKKQKRLLKTKVAEIVAGGRRYYNNPDLFCDSIEEINNFNRNKKLIDLRQIPSEISNSIMDEYNSLKTFGKSWMTYCAKHKLRQFVENQSWN